MEWGVGLVGLGPRCYLQVMADRRPPNTCKPHDVGKGVPESFIGSASWAQAPRAGIWLRLFGP